MNAFVPFAMFGWPLVVLGLFCILPIRRAVIVSFVVGWLFLPMAVYQSEGLPDYTKMVATCVSVFLALLLFDTPRVRSFRLQWVDLPMIIWCLVPLTSSLRNDLGLYDGLSSVFQQVVAWGLPYAIGRLYFADLDGLRALAIGLFLGGLVYVPFCLFEIGFGPELHHMVYGYYQHDYRQTLRFGGWRPMVFMQHGLMVGVWMMAASLSGLWLWRTSALTHFARLPMLAWVMLLLLTTLWLKSANAWVLLALGSVLLWSMWRYQVWLPTVGVIATVAIYVALRAAGLWSGDGLPQLVTVVVNEVRADSVAYRLDNENLIAAKARQRPFVGWGTWGRSQIYNDRIKRTTVVDSLWIQAFGRHGYLGLGSLFAVLVLPLLVLRYRHPVSSWNHPRLAPVAVLGLIVVLYAIDNCFNAMVNPIYMLAAGGLVDLAQFDAGPQGGVDHQSKGAVTLSRIADLP